MAGSDLRRTRIGTIARRAIRIALAALLIGVVTAAFVVGVSLGSARAQAELAAGTDEPVHPYPRTPPMVSRTFLPGSSPASIAVWLENGISYCWDAGEGFLRYAWEGGFLDNSEVFRGHLGGARARIRGTVFYRTEVGIPLRVGDPSSTPSFAFLGYRMRDRRPEFRYRLGDLEVREWVRSAEEGTGLVREFRVRGARDTVWFVADQSEEIDYEASAGSWSGRRLRLAPAEATSFTVTLRHVR